MKDRSHRLRDLRRDLSPIAELSMRAELLGGSLVVSGKVDLVLGRPDMAQPMRGQRLLIDLKTGSAWPQPLKDNRAYALLHTLRFGVPPYRVASFFLEGGHVAGGGRPRGTLPPRGRPRDHDRSGGLVAARGPRARAHPRPVVQLVSTRRRMSVGGPRRILWDAHTGNVVAPKPTRLIAGAPKRIDKTHKLEVDDLHGYGRPRIVPRSTISEGWRSSSDPHAGRRGTRRGRRARLPRGAPADLVVFPDDPREDPERRRAIPR